MIAKIALQVNAGSARGIAEQMSPDRLERILLKSLQRQMGPVVSAIKINTPVGTTSVRKGHLAGQLRRSVAFRTDTRGGLRVRIVAAPHGHLVEGGHRQVIGRGKRKGEVVGSVQAHPFVRPVVEAAVPDIQEGLAHDVERALLMAARIGHATGRPL